MADENKQTEGAVTNKLPKQFEIAVLPLQTTTLFPENSGKVVQRIRPRYNSEYIWNRPGLDAIGGLASDYHTKPMWITLP
jgi:hypothetical protein